jgi:hypothetical protein
VFVCLIKASNQAYILLGKEKDYPDLQEIVKSDIYVKGIKKRKKKSAWHIPRQGREGLHHHLVYLHFSSSLFK